MKGMENLIKKLMGVLLAAVMLTAVLGGCNKSSSLPQFEAVKSGDTIAVIQVGGGVTGTIRIKLFPEQAPKTVENFVSLAREGYYDGIVFHRVIDSFMIQGGDPTGTGMGGESFWGGTFEDEFADNMRNFRGALSMANAGAGTNGSQFFIVQADTSFIPDELYAQMKEYKEQYPDAVIEKYREVGGTPHLDYNHTVFGQVIEGMDVVDAIAGVETDASDKPVDPVIMERVTIETME